MYPTQSAYVELKTGRVSALPLAALRRRQRRQQQHRLRKPRVVVVLDGKPPALVQLPLELLRLQRQSVDRGLHSSTFQLNLSRF